MRISKGFIIVLAVVFLATSWNSAFAVIKQTQQQKGKTIFDYSAELKLSDAQTKKMKDISSSFDQELKVMKAKITGIEVEIKKLIEKDGDIKQIKSKIKESADLRAAMRISGIETRRKINAVMNQEQLRKWKEIQAAERQKKLAN